MKSFLDMLACENLFNFQMKLFEFRVFQNKMHMASRQKYIFHILSPRKIAKSFKFKEQVVLSWKIANSISLKDFAIFNWKNA